MRGTVSHRQSTAGLVDCRNDANTGYTICAEQGRRTCGEGVGEEDAGEQDGQELARGHDGGKQQRAVGADGVRDEQLPHRGRARQA